MLHCVMLAVHFTMPDVTKFEPADPGLEVILVNAKHDRAPVKAEALAQANLDGGGEADKGRAKSPLPDLQKAEDGDSFKASQRRIAELEEQQRKYLEQYKKKNSTFTVPRIADTEKPKETPQQPEGADSVDSTKALARSEAEINKSVEDYNKRPKKTFITPNTKSVGYAMYYNSARERIERMGTMNFPQKNGNKLYGKLTMSISIYQNGNIYDQGGEDGLKIDRSSGNPALDEAALRIVRRAAPFGRFPTSMRTTDKDDIWVLIVTFNFTSEEVKLEAEMH